MAAKKENRKVTKEHNQTDEERDARVAFHQTHNALVESDKKMASIKSGMAKLYATAEVYGWTKEDFAYARKIAGKEQHEVVEPLKRRIKIAEFFCAVTPNLFDIAEEDRTPAAEKAYQLGFSAGMNRGDGRPPYDPASEQGQEFLRGFNDGTAEINRQLDDAVSEIIPGEGDDGEIEEEEQDPDADAGDDEADEAA